MNVMLRRNGSFANATVLAGFALALASACAGSPWPDEPGIPVALSEANNLEAGDAFLTALTARRRSANLPAPIVTPRYQGEIRAFAENLQAGKTSVAGAERAIADWARAAYQREVIAFAIDCSRGERMELPSRLVELPSAVISYAAAHFRPRSRPNDQCAILVVALLGSEPIRAPTM